jgi:hypothetical protein
MSAELLTTSIASVPVLAFVLGVVGALLRADLRLPDAVYQATSTYLLLAIGIKGGVALRESDVGSVAAPALMTIALGVVIPVLAFGLLRALTGLDATDRGAMAAHYGSTSLVTFTAALVFLDSLGVSYEGFVSTLLAMLASVGTFIAVRNARQMDSVKEALAEEYRFTFRSQEEGELNEGVRATLVDKDRNPQWASPNLEDVWPDRAEYMLSSLGENEWKPETRDWSVGEEKA